MSAHKGEYDNCILYHYLFKISPKDNLKFSMVNADRIYVIVQTMEIVLDYYINRSGIIELFP